MVVCGGQPEWESCDFRLFGVQRQHEIRYRWLRRLNLKCHYCVHHKSHLIAHDSGGANCEHHRRGSK